MKTEIFNYKNIDFTKLRFSSPRKIDNQYISKIRIVPNNHSVSQPIYIQTPKITTTTGINKTENYCYLEVEFNPNQEAFYNFMCNVDELIVDSAFKNSDDWFNKELPREIIEDFYKSPIKPGRSSDAPPKIRFKIPLKDNSIAMEIYNQHRSGRKYFNHY